MKNFRIKQKIASFLLKEDGKVSKKMILKAGVIIGAMALAAKGVKAGHHWHNNSVYTGDCPNVDAAKAAALNAGPVSNVLHENNLFVKNTFGKLTINHDHCIESHSNSASVWHDDD